MKKLSIIFGVAAGIWICVASIILFIENKQLQQQVKYYKDQNRMSNELYDKYKAESDRCIDAWNERNNTVTVFAESTLRLKKQVDSLININHRKKPSGWRSIESVSNYDEWKTYEVPMSN